MKNYKSLHETFVKELLDLVNSFRDMDAEDILDKTKRNPYSSTSIAKLSSDMTLVFPVLCSNTLSIDTAMMISKALERKMTVMLQILFSSISLPSGEDAKSFINKLHNNIRLSNKLTIDDFINIADTFGECAVNKGHQRLLSEDFKQNAFFTFDESNISNKSLESIYGRNKYVLEAKKEKEENDANKPNINFKDVTDINSAFSKQLLSSDIKKANELVPTTMIINLNYVDDQNRVGKIQDVVIGVKCRLIPVTSEDIISHILTKLDDKNFVLQLIRATTREISFVKDFLLAIDRAKIEALSNSRRGSSNPMWKVLEHRAIRSRLRRFIGTHNDASAITTLVMSQEEVEYVRKNYNLDFDSIGTMNTVLDAYNLIGAVIVDETLETAKFHFDSGDDMWETLSFTSLEKEDKDSSYKKVVNLMSKISR